MPLKIRLPRANGAIEIYEMRGGGREWTKPTSPIKSRVAFSAAHVVCDPLADVDPTIEAEVDWDATLLFRRHLWSYGLAVAEAMDTAQRGMGLDWTAAQELIRRSLAEAKACNGRIACGAGTDQLSLDETLTLESIERAYLEQCEFIESHGGQVILMASRALARGARHADDYRRVYSRVLSQIERPAILHWLGETFDPQLRNYWGAREPDEAMKICLSIIHEHQSKIDGIKISLLDAEREILMRRLLPAGVRMYTGDDFNYDSLILGDKRGHSDALLGIFDAIAPAASNALQALDRGDARSYKDVLAPTVPLARLIFKAPTRFYKTGIVFLAYLNNHQTHFRMLGGQESTRSIVHFAEVFRLADCAGLLADAECAAARMRIVLSLAGID